VLLAIDKNPIDGTPGHFPIAWCHEYGQGRVFFTSLDNPDLWTDDATMGRKNTPETSRLFLTHLQGGVLWALGVHSSAKGQVPSAPPSNGAK
jgi:type 1 glutamine amidotransferase